jgi:hypothetical protein
VLTAATSVDAVAYPQRRVLWSEAPYVAALFHNQVPGIVDPDVFCTGALIDSRHVLTAAHCVSGLSAENILVGFGAGDLASSVIYGVADYEQHLRYTEPETAKDVGLPNDIALLRLTKPVDNVTPIKIPSRSDSKLRNGDRGMALYGWGQDQNGRIDLRLGFTNQRDYSKTAKRHFAKFNASIQIAAGYPLKRERLFAGACYGDSGGPLVGFDAKGAPNLVGIVSYGVSGCRSAAPSVFTRVSSYRNWFEEAKAAMAGRYETRQGIYTLRDALYDSDGPSEYVVDLVKGGVLTTAATTTFWGEVVYWSSAYTYRPFALLYHPDTGVVVGFLSPDGASHGSETAHVCKPTMLDTDGPIFGFSYATQCLASNFGATFDVGFVVATTDESTDTLRVAMVNLITTR